MTDQSWRGLESWDRIKWARSQRFESAAQAAAAVGMKEGTYRAYERGPESAKHIRLDYDHAVLFARKFGVRWEWLLNNEDEPWLTPRDEEALAEAAPNHLKAWREFRGMTRAALAARAGTTAQTIAQLESGEIDLSAKRLRVLADALKTTAGFLVDYDPNDIDPAFIEEAMSVPKERRDQVIQILRTFRAAR